jgi:hypothetical protein
MSHHTNVKYKDDFVQLLVDFVAADAFQVAAILQYLFSGSCYFHLTLCAFILDYVRAVQNKFEAFFLEHALEFTDDEELKLGYYDRYRQFQSMFEEELEMFCDSLGISQVELLRHCKQASTTDPKADQYIQILLSSAEFDTFLKLMRIMRPVALMRLAEADGKNNSKSKHKSGRDRDDDRKPSKAEEDLGFEVEGTSTEMTTLGDAKSGWEVERRGGRSNDDHEGSHGDHKKQQLQSKQSK